MDELFDAGFYEALQHLMLVSHIKINAGMSGSRKSRAKGTSVEFADFREYQLGDDIRRIDWNAYGRMNKLFVKLFVEEREGYFTIVSDCSGSMDYGQAKKFDCSRRVAAMFAFMILKNMDRVRLVSLGEERIKCGKSFTGNQAFAKICDELWHYQAEGRVDLGGQVQKIPFHGSGVTFVLSDFLDQEHLEEMCRYLLYKKQEIVLVQILSKEEYDPDWEGNKKLVGIEDGKEMRMSFSSGVLAAYHKAFDQAERNLKQLAARYQAGFLQIHAEEPMEIILAKAVKNGQLQQIG